MIIGIDLGTTNSVAAYMSKDGPRLIPNALGEVLTPSVIGIEPSGTLLVGAAAKELRVTYPERCASVFKRYMGTEWSTDLAGRNFTPEQLSSLVLRSLKQDAEAHLEQPVGEAVITVPAYFNELQRKATLMAGRMAGFDVRRILNEPTAAALAYGVHESGANKVYVVVDLGGGTFDVSVVDLFEGALEVRASSGESFLGGEDFSRTLAARVLERAGYVFERAELEQPKLVSRMLQLCEVAKCQLSRQATATVRIADRDGNLPEDCPAVTFTREQFEGWSQHILARIEMPIRRAMGDAKLKPADLDEVVLVGGATRMPMVIDRITRLLARTPQCRLNPDEVVAVGAAVQAGLIASDKNLEDMVVTDVAPFTLGIEITKRIGLETRNGHFLPIIHRNTTIPVSRVERVGTVAANQTQIRIKVYQGESRRVEGNLLLGEFLVRDIPRGPPGQDIDVRFTYDLNGVLQIEAVVVETKQKVSHLITRYAHGLSEEQIAQAVEAMESLKTHPRDEASNRFLLRRAERLYQELPMLERSMLAELLDGFEAALALSDKEAVQRFRESLQEMLDRFEIADDDSYGPSDE